MTCPFDESPEKEDFTGRTVDTDGPDGLWELAKIRDRLLLYVRGMDIEPSFSLKLALEALEYAGKHYDAVEPYMETAMNELFYLLEEKNISHQLMDEQGQLLSSAPPMNRQTMLTEEMDGAPLRWAIKKIRESLRSAKSDHKL